ncbi:MAG: chromosomal replication initiator protein DnaA [Syntrophobacteraceae bacterium]
MVQEWKPIQAKLMKSLPRGQYDLWVASIQALCYEDDRLVLSCGSRFQMEWLREKLEAKILNAARQHLPNLRKVEYRIGQTPRQDPPAVIPDEPEPEGPRQISFGQVIKRLEPTFNPRFTFDQFVVGNSNQLAYAASMAMTGAQQFVNQSVYLLSQTGLGKSHLTHAVGNHLLNEKPGLRVHYTTTEQFTNEMVFALKHGNMEEFKNKFRSQCDVLLIERIEFLSGKARIQDELVHTLDELMDRGKKVLCTGNSFPRDIPKLSSELKSRLGGILVAPIEPPDFATRVAIIRRKAEADSCKLPMDIVEFLADRLTGDIRQMESCLVGILAKSSILRIPITLGLAQEITQTMLDHLPKITVDHIQQVICASFQISVEELRSPSRRQELAMARKIAMYLCRQYTTDSLESIGRAFKRSHSSVLYAVNGLDKEIKEKNSKWKRQVDYVSHRLETSCLAS